MLFSQVGRRPLDVALEREVSTSLFALLDPGLAWLEEMGVSLIAPLVSAAEVDAFKSLSKLLDPNPRRLKRIVNVYALVTEVAKQMPQSEDDSTARLAYEHTCHRVSADYRCLINLVPRHPCTLQKVDQHPNWKRFCPKLTKWICLCENYPYRISFLVLVITDLVQKEMVNQLHDKHPSRGEYGLVYYKKSKSGNLKADVEESLELEDDMPIVEAYFRHVERYIYSHKSATKMLGLDGDPVRALSTHGPDQGLMRCLTVVQEMFTALLMLPVSDLGKSDEASRLQAASGKQQCDITIGDILGPLKEVNGSAGSDGVGKTSDGTDATQRDANFSLLSYSFNLVGPSGVLESHPGIGSVAG